jgi:uncharacterized integral membrane protein (TIGR00697 family)
MNIRKFDVVVSLYIFGVMIAELMGAKTIPILTIGHQQFNASVAIFVMPLLFTITDVIVEVYGRARARSVVYSGLIMVFLLLLFSMLATSLPPSTRYAASESAYDSIFKASVQIAFASIVAFAASELMDVFIFSKLRQRLGRRALWLRNNVSNFVSQLVDSTVFVTLAFYSFQMTPAKNAHFLIGIILPYWIVRCVFSVAGTPLVYLGVGWLRSGKSKDQTGQLAEGEA